jgi:hypothetical protein
LGNGKLDAETADLRVTLSKVRVEKRTQAALRCISRNDCEDKRREGSLRPPWFFVQSL